jgi:hypothetical protein
MKASASTLSIPVFSFRRIETPYERSLGFKNYVAVIDVRNLPDLAEWREINVRDAKLRGRVPNAIRASFAEQPDQFLFMNRGLVIAAERIEYKEGDGGKIIDVIMREPKVHGLLDGGHTYTVTRDSLTGLPENDAPRYVRVEFITGVDRDTISDVVEARNTSNQVKDESLANLREEFEPIKEVLQEQPYYDLIAWSEYEELATGKPKPIDIRDIISFLITFDTHAYSSTTQPMIAYKDKRACLRHFQEHGKKLQKFLPLLPDFLRLWDSIHMHWPTWYGEGREEEAGFRGRFGKLTAVQLLPEQLYFLGTKAKYRMPEAYKYPILSALRAAVKANGKSARWVSDPYELLNVTGQQLASVVGNTVRATQNANKVGKDVSTWSSCYLVVEAAMQSTMKLAADKRIEQLEAELETLKRTKRR